MTSLAALLLSHGARTIPSSRLAKEVIHLGNRPVCFTTWYKVRQHLAGELPDDFVSALGHQHGVDGQFLGHFDLIELDEGRA